jgi:hypothetical protein
MLQLCDIVCIWNFPKTMKVIDMYFWRLGEAQSPGSEFAD